MFILLCLIIMGLCGFRSPDFPRGRRLFFRSYHTSFHKGRPVFRRREALFYLDFPPGAFIGERKNRMASAYHEPAGGICFSFDGPPKKYDSPTRPERDIFRNDKGESLNGSPARMKPVRSEKGRSA